MVKTVGLMMMLLLAQWSMAAATPRPNILLLMAEDMSAPSRAAHILGMHQIATGTQHMRSSTRPEGGYFSVPPDGVKAYPELLRAAGYYILYRRETGLPVQWPLLGQWSGVDMDAAYALVAI